jgi:hypothetical protein
MVSELLLFALKARARCMKLENQSNDNTSMTRYNLVSVLLEATFTTSHATAHPLDNHFSGASPAISHP